MKVGDYLKSINKHHPGRTYFCEQDSEEVMDYADALIKGMFCREIECVYEDGESVLIEIVRGQV